jgi:hypothetical protein
MYSNKYSINLEKKNLKEFVKYEVKTFSGAACRTFQPWWRRRWISLSHHATGKL